MIDLMFTKTVNPDLLHEQIAAVIGARLIGISTAPEESSPGACAGRTLSPADRDQVAALVTAHDGTQLTTCQQREITHQPR